MLAKHTKFQYDTTQYVFARSVLRSTYDPGKGQLEHMPDLLRCGREKETLQLPSATVSGKCNSLLLPWRQARDNRKRIRQESGRNVY